MTTIYSIDPSAGVRSALGWACWLDGRLISAGLVRGAPNMKLDQLCGHYLSGILSKSPPPIRVTGTSVGGAVVVWVEQMEMSRQRDGKDPVYKLIAKANDLLALQAVGAYVAGALGGTLRYATPGTWKGTAPKAVTEARARNVLTPQELAVVSQALQGHPGGLAHNIWDSVGIGLHAVGRYRLPGRAA